MLFNRNCSVNISDFEFTTMDNKYGKGLTIDWSYDIRKYSEPAKLKVSIYNPDIAIISEIKQLDPVVFSFGYDDITELFFSGFLDKFDFKTKGVDRVLEISCIEQDTLIFKDLSVSYNSNTKASYVISDVLKRAGFIIKQLDLESDIIYSSGYCVYGKPINEVREVAKDCGSRVKIEGKEVFVYINEVNNNVAVLLDFESGLLESPIPAMKSAVAENKKKENDTTLYTHKVKSLAIPSIKKNSIIVIQTDEIEMTGQVIEITINGYEAEYKIKRRD